MGRGISLHILGFTSRRKTAILQTMITVLSGPDSYRRRKRAQFIVNEFKAAHPQAPVMRLDGNEPEAGERFIEFIRSTSLFEPRKLLVLEPLFADGTRLLGEALKRTAEDKLCSVLISTDTAPISPFAFLKKESKGTITEQFPKLTGEKLAAWLADEAKAHGITLSSGAAQLLQDAYGADTWSLATELQKLASRTERSVSEEDLTALGVETAPDFIGGIRGLTAPSVTERLASLARVLASGEPAQKIFSMLPYWWPARLEMLANYDRGVKSGKLDYEEALTDVLIR